MISLDSSVWPEPESHYLQWLETPFRSCTESGTSRANPVNLEESTQHTQPLVASQEAISHGSFSKNPIDLKETKTPQYNTQPARVDREAAPLSSHSNHGDGSK